MASPSNYGDTTTNPEMVRGAPREGQKRLNQVVSPKSTVIPAGRAFLFSLLPLRDELTSAHASRGSPWRR
jgi:hypothetical protein